MFLVDQNGPSLPTGMPAPASFGSGIKGPAAIVGTADVVLGAAQSGAMLVARKGSGNQLFTLPPAQSGLLFTFVCGNTLTGMTIKPGDATAVMHAKANAAGAAITSTANTGSLVNTQGTAVLGDTLTLECDGTDWWMTAQSGIFAAT